MSESEWISEANCRGLDVELFFPRQGDTATVRAAKEVCRGCTVRQACLQDALDNDVKFGIFGGTSERERRRLRRQIKRNRAAS